MSNSNIEINFISDLDEITSIVSSIGDDDSLFSDEKLIKKLQSGKTVFCCLKDDSEVYYFGLLEHNPNRLIVQLYRFETKTSNQEFLNIFLNKCFDFGKKFKKSVYIVGLPFRLTSDVINIIRSDDYKIFERESMTLNLQECSFQKPDLSNYSIKSNISDYAKEIIEFVMIANKNKPDAEIYPEFSNYASMEDVLGLKEPKKHHFDEKASVLLFYNDKLIGINLIRVINNSLAIVFELAIHPDFRRRKLGYNSMVLSILTLKEMGMKELILLVTVGNPAQRIYEAVGFKTKETGTVLRKNYD